MRIAQLSDLHLTPDARPLYGTVDTEAALHLALMRARALDPAPDVLVLSGDLANGGDTATYLRLRTRLAALPVPYALIPGNHDSREGLRKVFPDQGWEGGSLCCRKMAYDGGVLLLLDSIVPGEEGGEIADAQLAWLDKACLEDEPALLFQHHPPFEIGIPGMDEIRCRGEERLAEWLIRHPNVEAVLCGHVHRFVATSFAGRPALTAPSTAHQIALQGGALAYTLEPGGFLLHDWQPGIRLLTHYVPASTAPVHVYTD